MSEVIPFSKALRQRSSGAHTASEHAGFMARLVGGDGTRGDYIALVAQHWFIYAALEAAAERMRVDPVAAPFISDKLTRLPALESDLEFLVGARWQDQIEPTSTTRRYVARINQVGATWPGGFVAHHYTRYLGDLSGGLYIGRLMARQFGFETNGIGFYIFADIADPQAFKEHYREQLDAAPWDAEEQARVIDEVLVAYQFNTDLFEELGTLRSTEVA